MPAKVKVRIVAGRDLPVMDRASELTDAFVEVKFAGTTHKTEVCRKSLNPQWNSEWFRFEVDDEDLQDEPLQIRVLDHDTYSAHDAIGKVYIELNPLLTKEAGSIISGWFPIYDTMHGIRGELNVTVKVDLFSDFNKFRQSSCGVQFFCTSGVPYTYRVHAIRGFVEELVVNDDPEYQWIDKIRSQRASNEARQIQFSKLSGELQRKIGLKVLELGGNAVTGYRQCFDLEGESGVVVRAIGTAVSLSRHTAPSFQSPHSGSPTRDSSSVPTFSTYPVSQPLPLRHRGSTPGYFPALSPLRSCSSNPFGSSDASISPNSSVPAIMLMSSEGVSSPLLTPSNTPPSTANSSLMMPEDCGSPTSGTPTKFSTSPGKVPLQRRNSDSDIDTPPKGGSTAGSSGSGGAGSFKAPFHRPVLQQQSIEMLEFPFFTIKWFPPGFLVHIGGMVSARSVKLLDRIHNPDEPETRDAWWTELRTEIRSHARALGCHAVIGYSEQTSICDEIIVLSACGTAAILSLRMDVDVGARVLTQSLDRSAFEKEKELAKIEKDKDKEKTKKLHVDVNLANQVAASTNKRLLTDGEAPGYIPNCSICHIPYSEASLPFPVNLARCAVCRRHKVPDILFTTIEHPQDMPIVGRGCLVQARICRTKKDAKGETNAKEISDCLPFMEYELYNQLVNKLKLRGMNTLFALKVQIVVGEMMLVAIATGTAVYSAPLPSPAAPKILGKMETTGGSMEDLQRRVFDAVNKNKDTYQLYPAEEPSSAVSEFLTVPTPDFMTEVSDECLSPRYQLTDDEEDLPPPSEAELHAGNRDTFVLEVDDAEDAAVISVLLDPPPPDGFDVCTTETMPGVHNLACNLQMFTRVWRGTLNNASNKTFSAVFDNLLKSTYFKLRTMTPCTLCHLDFDVDVHDEDDVQVSLTGICMGVGEPQTISNGLVDIASAAKPCPLTAPLISDHDDLLFHMDGVSDSPATTAAVSSQIGGSAVTTAPSTLVMSTPVMYHRYTGAKSGKQEKTVRYYSGARQKNGWVELTPLSYVPGSRIEHYRGHLNFFIIRESTSVREIGGLSGFLHSFVAEVNAICRAHVSALGGNALVAYQMSECVLDDHLNKNQSQCLVNVSGDVVHVTYDIDSSNTPNSSTRPGNTSPQVTSGPPSSHKRPSTPKGSPKIEKLCRS